MKILLLDVLDQPLQDALLADNVIYRPDLLHKSQDMLARTLIEGGIDALISSDPVPRKAIDEWAAANAAPVYVVRVVIPDPNAQDLLDYAPSGEIEAGNSMTLQAVGKSLGDAYVNAFELLEARWLRHALRSRVEREEAAAPETIVGRTKVLLVGAGLVNLVTGFRLQQEGYAVHFIDARPDPGAAHPWTAYGCTHGGDDARMFTLSEMDNYNDRQVSLTMNNLFRRSVTELGWNVHWKETLSDHEMRWVREFEGIPVWLADKYNEDIFALSRASHPRWTRWIDDDPDLFSASLLREGILRLYSDDAQFAGAVRRQNRIGATRQVLTPQEVAQRHPALADAVRGGHIAGGIHVVGFTVNAHKFVRGLLQRLRAGGAEFTWGCAAQRLEREAAQRVRRCAARRHRDEGQDPRRAGRVAADPQPRTGAAPFAEARAQGAHHRGREHHGGDRRARPADPRDRLGLRPYRRRSARNRPRAAAADLPGAGRHGSQVLPGLVQRGDGGGQPAGQLQVLRAAVDVVGPRCIRDRAGRARRPLRDHGRAQHGRLRAGARDCPGGVRRGRAPRTRDAFRLPPEPARRVPGRPRAGAAGRRAPGSRARLTAGRAGGVPAARAPSHIHSSGLADHEDQQ